MENSEVLLALAHPGVAFLIGLLFAVVAGFERKPGYFRFFSGACVLYGVGVLMQIVLVPQPLAANITLSGLFYLSAAMLYCRALFQLGGRPAPILILGIVFALAVLLRAYFTFADPNSSLRAGALQAAIFVMMAITGWEIRHLRSGQSYERLLFWLVWGFTLSFVPRTGLLMGRDVTQYGYDGSPYWLAVQATFYAFTVLLALVLLLVAAGRAMHLIRQASYLDPLTRTHNRTGFRSRMAASLADCDRYALIILDIDHFKDVNDSYGHAVGDSVLREVGALLNRKLRPQDTVARYGGEEFLVLLPDADAAGAGLIATRLRKAIEALDLSEFAPDLYLTASAGVAAFDADVPLERAYRQIDALLYRAKGAGRNQTWGEFGPIAE